MRKINSDRERQLYLSYNQTSVQDKNSKQHIMEVKSVRMENYKSSKQFEELKQEIFESGDKLGKEPKEN